jgi:hypothetical protein
LVHAGLAKTGVVGVIEGRPGSHKIGLHALPMTEAGRPPWRSSFLYPYRIDNLLNDRIQRRPQPQPNIQL